MVNGGGISLAGVDNVISAWNEYKQNIESFLDQIADTQEYTKAYKGFEKSVQAFVNQVCDTIRVGVVQRVEGTVQALSKAKEEYSSQSEKVSSEVSTAGSKFTFDAR